MGWADLVTWVIVFHLVVVYQMNSPRAYWRIDWQLPIKSIYGVGMTSSYRFKAEHTWSQWGPVPKHGHLE